MKPFYLKAGVSVTAVCMACASASAYSMVNTYAVSFVSDGEPPKIMTVETFDTQGGTRHLQAVEVELFHSGHFEAKVWNDDPIKSAEVKARLIRQWALSGPDIVLFHLVIFVENASGGLGTTVFVAYLSSLCNIHYTAVQYALLTSFMQLLGKFVVVPSSGFFADALGWELFFVASTSFALPALLLLWLLQRQGITVRAVRAET